MRFEFAGCELDDVAHVLRRAGETVAVEPQVFDILRVLAARAGAVVTKDDLIETVWDGRIVSDATISARVSAARAAVGDTGRDQAIIRTVSRRGFQMVAEVTALDAAETPAAPSGAGDGPPRQTIRYTSASDGGGIAWSSAGTGPPLLLAWHHFSHLEQDWNSRLLRPLFAALGTGRSLIRFDIRGTGLSDALPQEATLDDCVDDMKAVADAAGLERFPIFATLQAATVAFRFAARYPERVSRMVTHNGYARGRAVRDGGAYEPENDPFISLIKSGSWGDPENGFMRAWTTMSFPMASSDDITAMIRLISQSASSEAALRHRILIDRFDVTGDLARVRAPTRVIHARACAIHPVGEARRVAAGIPAAELVEVDSSNTVLIGSDPAFARIMDAALEFLSEDGT